MVHTAAHNTDNRTLQKMLAREENATDVQLLPTLVRSEEIRDCLLLEHQSNVLSHGTASTWHRD
jgi:hypothetical protein